MSVRKISFIALAAAVASVALARKQDEFEAKIMALPHVHGISFKQDTNVPGSPKIYTITFEQPVDHTNPNGPKFEQRIFLRHQAFDKPVLLGTEGYEARGPYGGELMRILGTPNQLTVEHRYFGTSTPKNLDWKFLTIKNAADDMHEIVTAFHKLYTGKWVASGASKGGQTSLFYKCYYPSDVDVTVAYVAPINLGQEDPRIYRWLDTVGDEATRRKIKDLQIAFLKREDEIIPLLNVKASDYSMGLAKAYEYGVLEFPFALWQYGTKPEGLPSPDAPAADLVKSYNQVNPLYYYSDKGKKFFEPFYYQAFTEIGYYNYDITDFKPFLKANPNPTNMDLCPPGTKETIVYNPNTLAFVYNFLQYKADNVIYVYGETDTWSATQMELIGRTNAVKIMVRGAYHNASIRAASPEQRSQVYDAMDTWLGFRTNRL